MGLVVVSVLCIRLSSMAGTPKGQDRLLPSPLLGHFWHPFPS